jgi:hypothetical protein
MCGGMAEIRTVTTLRSKRAEILASISLYEKRLAQARADLAAGKTSPTAPPIVLAARRWGSAPYEPGRVGSDMNAREGSSPAGRDTSAAGRSRS